VAVIDDCSQVIDEINSDEDGKGQTIHD